MYTKILGTYFSKISMTTYVIGTDLRRQIAKNLRYVYETIKQNMAIHKLRQHNRNNHQLLIKQNSIYIYMLHFWQIYFITLLTTYRCCSLVRLVKPIGNNPLTPALSSLLRERKSYEVISACNENFSRKEDENYNPKNIQIDQVCQSENRFGKFGVQIVEAHIPVKVALDVLHNITRFYEKVFYNSKDCQ